MRYDFVDLRLLTAIADTGSVSRGAEACHLAASSASLRIRRLEEAIGAKLFDRTARGVTLTRAGHVMREHSRRFLAQVEQMHADLTPYVDGVNGHVTLFANSNAIASFIPQDIQPFLRSHEGVRIQMEERLSHDVVSAVADGRADLGVVAWDGSHPALKFYPYRRDELVVVAGNATKLPQANSISFADSLQFPFVCLQSGSAIHTFIVGKANALGRHLDVRIQVAGFQAVVALVRSGVGLGIVPRSIVQNAPLKGIRILSLPEEWAIRHLRICVPVDPSRISRHAMALLTHLKAAGGQCAEAAEVA